MDKLHADVAMEYAQWCKRVVKTQAVIKNLRSKAKEYGATWATKQRSYHVLRLQRMLNAEPPKP